MKVGGSTQNLPISPYGLPRLADKLRAGRPTKSAGWAQGKQEHQATPPRHKVTLKQIDQPCISRRPRFISLSFLFACWLVISSRSATHTAASTSCLASYRG